MLLKFVNLSELSDYKPCTRMYVHIQLHDRISQLGRENTVKATM